MTGSLPLQGTTGHYKVGGKMCQNNWTPARFRNALNTTYGLGTGNYNILQLRST